MKKLILAALIMLFLATGNALAITTADIDGYDKGEWTNLLTSITDPNESTIHDDYDIHEIGMIWENNGNVNDGLYLGFLLYGIPTFGTYPGETGAAVPWYQTILDFNGNGALDANDRRIWYSSVSGNPTIIVYDGVGNIVSGTALAAMGVANPTYPAGVEWFVPKSMFVNDPSNGFYTYSRLDNGGKPEEDYIPDQGWTHVPEPATMAMFGIGLLGFGGAIRKRFMA